MKKLYTAFQNVFKRWLRGKTPAHCTKICSVWLRAGQRASVPPGPKRRWTLQVPQFRWFVIVPLCWITAA